MNRTLMSAVESAISAAVGETTEVLCTSQVSGGCIHNANIVSTNTGRDYFFKSNPDVSASHMFATEVHGLAAIRNSNTIAVPEVIAVGTADSGEAFLVMEAVQPGPRSAEFAEVFGRQLAEMHRQASSALFGFAEDNFIGATVQPNPQSSDWAEFWIEHRIGFQLKLACDNGYGSALKQFGSSFSRAIRRVLEQLHEAPALIHGDLWSGNYLVSAAGSPVLIDPAAYYAHREAEFGMTTLFGGFDRKFYDAYDEAFPLAEGWEERVEIYRLYHLLNHLNLFGRSYLSGCLEIMQKYV